MSPHVKHKKFLLLIALPVSLIFLFWIPYGLISLQHSASIISDYHDLPNADVAIIFGAGIHADGTLSEVTLERTVAGQLLLEKGIVDELVVSNTEVAAGAMKNYLLENGTPLDDISIDPFAVTTPDTCRYEKNQNEERTIIFLTQGYHLPRTMYQCGKLEVHGIGFPVESLNMIEKSELTAFETFSIRTTRIIREAALTWMSVLNLYE